MPTGVTWHRQSFYCRPGGATHLRSGTATNGGGRGEGRRLRHQQGCGISKDSASVHCEGTACGGKAGGCVVPAEEARAESMSSSAIRGAVLMVCAVQVPRDAKQPTGTKGCFSLLCLTFFVYSSHQGVEHAGRPQPGHLARLEQRVRLTAGLARRAAAAPAPRQPVCEEAARARRWPHAVPSSAQGCGWAATPRAASPAGAGPGRAAAAYLVRVRVRVRVRVGVRVGVRVRVIHCVLLMTASWN